ncbi:MAG: ATP-dependent helicase [Candidatus Nanoarchaeia archaeon]|nr:ATP-dependent helicase [Candidatus Nanoarchaeia archaeon]
MKVSSEIKSNVNEEKIKVLEAEGSALITANPGTGKTFLLTCKYLVLIDNGLSPKDILCLTFTAKAKNELENRLIEALKKRKDNCNLSDIKVHTFHSYALEYLDSQEVVSSNLLRYAIYEVLKEKEVLNYGDSYLIDTIVPKMENLLRYLKSFNVLPKDIDLKLVKSKLQGDTSYTKEEIETFASYFVEIFNHYEKIKSSKGIDYSDMLINFLKMKEVPKFKYVLIDELQDVNALEADIALRSCEEFIAVGDKKQAIFGFQGGSINNFEKFNKAKKFILSSNFRSSQEILDYAKYSFIDKTKNESSKEDLKELRNEKNKSTVKPMVYLIDKEKIVIGACELAIKIAESFKKDSDKQVAIIARTNSQVIKISKELKARNVEHSSTYFSASKEAKTSIITFLKGVFGVKIEDVKNSMFTPFFPITIQTAFELAADKKLTIETIYKACPKFKELKESVTNTKEVAYLFDNYIMPISVSYGKEYVFAAMSIKDSFDESLQYLEKINYENINNFMQSSDLLSRDIDSKSKIVVSTVHKSKGLEYDQVIYLPKKNKGNKNFADTVVEAILKTKNINADEELEEEDYRIDFVAFTRAKDKLFIMAEKPEEYITKYCDSEKYETSQESMSNINEKLSKAFTLFVSKDYESAKKYLENNESWIKDFINNYFKNLEKISFTSINTKAFNFLTNNILSIRESSFEMNLGTKVHNYAESLLNGLKPEEDEELKPYYDNVKKLINEIKKTYPEIESAEKRFNFPVKELFAIDYNFKFSGVLDAVFKNKNEYLIVDWKTSKNDSSASEYRQQLSGYKKALSLINEIPESKIKTAIGYVGLKAKINNGKISSNLDDSQPRATAIKTLTTHLEKIIEWKKDPNIFIEELINAKEDNPLWRAVIEQIKKEKNN